MSRPAPDPDPALAGRRSPGSLRWLSHDYGQLRARARKGWVWDVVIVGSGYGGAMAAAELAGLRKPQPDAQGRTEVSVCVLERGGEYAPGMFPSSLQELPPHVRIHRRGHDAIVGRAGALLDVRVGPHVSTLVGNGLGGGSLINAGVMEPPRWRPGQGLPQGVERELEPLYAQVKEALRASDRLKEHPDLKAAPLAKTQVLRRFAEATPDAAFRDAAITVQTEDGDPDVPRCTLCGDCMTGCNVGAKRSLDTTLLRRAHAAGAQIYTGGTVLHLEQAADGGWLLQTVYTDAGLRSRHQPQAVRARKVILAAGTLGSTEILLHSRSLSLSRRLGSGFSCNGDNLVARHGGPEPVRTTTDEFEPLAARRVGPTITGVVEFGDVLVEEFAVPAPLKRLFDETVTTARLLNRLPRWPDRSPGQKRLGLDSMAVDPDAMENTLLVGVIGHDESQGHIVIPDPLEPQEEGRAGIEWPQVRESPLMEQAWRQVRDALARSAPCADVLPNPAWRPVPDAMASLAGGRGPIFTVHPLGGCPMGESHVDGVVDTLGRVFRVTEAGGEPYDGLVVLDGSILPHSVGANPALTISALAMRSARQLAAAWGWGAASAPAAPAASPQRTRPQYRPPADCTPPRPQATQVELVERLAGAAGSAYWVELTLCYERANLAQFTGLASREVRLYAPKSFLRVYDNRNDARRTLLTLGEKERSARALYTARISGTMTLAEPRAGLGAAWHALRAAGAWLVNRGTRELWDVLTGRQGNTLDACAFVGSAGRAGELRLFHYRLEVGEVVQAGEGNAALQARTRLPPGTPIEGSKCLTYGLRSNPCLQLTQLRLQGFPLGEAAPTLCLDTRFIARESVPLLRIIQQENQVVALAEFASFLLCWVRMLASIHLWSFRAPDPAPPRVPVLLPGAIRDLPAPEVCVLPLEKDPHSPLFASVRLTRYPHKDRPPVALIHGYSASGTTFTHEAIPQPLARHLWNMGRDVWVLDLRTSAGLPTAKDPWRFEDAAFADLPVALDLIRHVTGQRVSVFAHCIGAVMLGMALLTEPGELGKFERSRGDGPTPKRWGDELGRLADNVDRIVLSQKGPMLVYRDDNVLRAYLLRALRKLVFSQDYQFRVPQGRTLAGDLMDRVLATLPYPPEEFVRENPWIPWQRTPWAGFRHRMDALYARDFSLRNIEDRTLAAIEDLFGPLNLDTVAQAIHFARRNTITDGNGRPFDTSGARLAARWPRRGTVSIHGAENGLVDVKTLDVMRSQMAFAGIPYLAIEIPGYGHQDCLVGRDAARDVFPFIAANL
ncbi:MAG: GMC family oxidoreductase N-terminal domain-containing protein [Burkholderiales bacterium]|nr:GMC family oxidoreductase N-terminal domain-containing protein [Burkholderiales bacterium]